MNNKGLYLGIGRGMNYSYKKWLMETISIQDIVNNHLNNNNWLRRHKKPMIRRGHQLHSECKKYKGLSPFEIIVTDPEQEYKSIENKLSNKAIKFQDGDIEKIDIYKLN